MKKLSSLVLLVLLISCSKDSPEDTAVFPENGTYTYVEIKNYYNKNGDLLATVSEDWEDPDARMEMVFNTEAKTLTKTTYPSEGMGKPYGSDLVYEIDKEDKTMINFYGVDHGDRTDSFQDPSMNDMKISKRGNSIILSYSFNQDQFDDRFRWWFIYDYLESKTAYAVKGEYILTKKF